MAAVYICSLLLGVLLLPCTLSFSRSRIALDVEDMMMGEDELEKRSAITSRAEIAQCVKSTNALRSKHRNTGPLRWDAGLAREAQKYAEHLLRLSYQSGRAQLIHEKPSRGMGENLFWADNAKAATCVDADKAWYSEINDYSFSRAGTKNGYPVGHFTQLVWKDTTKFGIGVAVGDSIKFKQYGNKQTFIVAKYKKPGNFYMSGQRKKYYSANVQPLKG